MTMKPGWKTVLRLGSEGACFPHVKVDAHGWCLRLGPDLRNDEKYYATLPALLQGWVEQALRRRLGEHPKVGLESLAQAVRTCLDEVQGRADRLIKELRLKPHPLPEMARPAPQEAAGSPCDRPGAANRLPCVTTRV